MVELPYGKSESAKRDTGELLLLLAVGIGLVLWAKRSAAKASTSGSGGGGLPKKRVVVY